MSLRLTKSKIVVVGVGNPSRMDDAVGIHVARKLRKNLPPSIRVIEATGESTSLMEAWKDASAVVLIDAASSGSAPGTIHRFDASSKPLPTKLLRHSSHTMGVGEAIELARTLNQLPPKVIVYGIEGKDFADGLELSPHVQRAVEPVVMLLLEEIVRLLHTKRKVAVH